MELNKPLFVNKYLVLNNTDKKLKRKLKKHKIEFISKKADNKIDTLIYYLKECKQNFCVLDNTNKLTRVEYIPPTPNDFDILYLEADILKYHYKNETNNVYWCKSDIVSSGHFVINYKSKDKIFKILKSCKKWEEIFNKFNELNTYTITQYFYSEKIDQTLLETSVSVNELTEKYNECTKEFDETKKYLLLPSISLICPITDTNRFIHTLYTFYKLDYPRDKLELLIIDDIDSDKKLKNILPEDSRIKIINITKKDKNDEFVKFPLGYKLNLGVKYAKNDILLNFFDTNTYIPNIFRNIIKCYLVANKDCIYTNNTILYNNKKFTYSTTGDLANLIYRKSFWEVFKFDENEVNLIDFIKFRINCTNYINLCSFKYGETSLLKENIKLEDFYTDDIIKSLEYIGFS